MARTVSSQNGSQLWPTSATPSRPAASAVRMMVPRLPGIADAVERDPDAAPADRVGLGEALAEDAEDALRIVAPGDLLQDRARDLQHGAAGRLGVRAASAPTAASSSCAGGVGERVDRPAAVDRVAHQLLALGDEQAGLVALLLLVQGADVLDQRIGEAGHLAEDAGPRDLGARCVAHRAVQRTKREVARCAPPFSRSASSPASTPAAEDLRRQALQRQEGGADGVGGEDEESVRLQDVAAEAAACPAGSGRGPRPRPSDRARISAGRGGCRRSGGRAGPRARRISWRRRGSSGSACRPARTGAWLSRAQAIAFFEASTCVTSAPASAATREARPV